MWEGQHYAQIVVCKTAHLLRNIIIIVYYHNNSNCLVLCRKLSGVTLMQAMGHQVVGSDRKSHEDVKLMYEKFFGGQAIRLKRILRKELGSIQIRRMLSKIFQVYDSVKMRDHTWGWTWVSLLKSLTKWWTSPSSSDICGNCCMVTVNNNCDKYYYLVVTFTI